MQSDPPNRDRYLANRTVARTRAEQQLTTENPELHDLLALGDEYVARLMFFVSGTNMSVIPNGLYIGDLMISFTRTHFIAEQLLLQGEPIEGATLVRKQIELLARLHELGATKDHARLLRRTPNVARLQTNLKRLYTAYSELAHSSDPQHLQQLGRINVDGKQYTPLYPVFEPNSLITLRHLILTVVEYHHWATAFLSRHYESFDEEATLELIGQIAEQYMAMRDGS
jgi:hypothetical protein